MKSEITKDKFKRRLGQFIDFNNKNLIGEKSKNRRNSPLGHFTRKRSIYRSLSKTNKF